MMIKMVRQKRLLVVLLLAWALVLPKTARGSWTVSADDTGHPSSVQASSSNQGPQAYSISPPSAPGESWAESEKSESEKNDSDGDNEHRMFSSSSFDFGLVAVLVGYRPNRMVSRPSPSHVHPHPRC